MIPVFGIFFAAVVAISFFNKRILVILLAVFTPLYAANINIGFTITFTRVLILVILIRIILSLTSQSVILRLPSSMKYFYGIAIAGMLSSYFAIDYIEHLRQIFIFINCALVFLFTFNLVNDIEVLFLALKSYILAGIGYAFVGIYQVIGFFLELPMYQDFIYVDDVRPGNARNLIGTFYSGEDAFPRAFGFSSDPNIFGIYMISVIFCSVVLIYYKKIVRTSGFTIFIALVALLLTLSRSSFLALILSLIIYWLIKNLIVPPSVRNKIFNKNLNKIAITLILVATLGVLTNTVLGEILLTRFDHFINGQSSFSGHVSTRLQGFRLFTEYPILGSGLDYNAVPRELFGEDDFGGSHAFWLDMLVGMGLIGLMMWALFIYENIKIILSALKKTFLRQDHAMSFMLIIFLTSISTFVLASFFYHTFPSDFIWFLMGLFISGAKIVYVGHRNT